jgi:hypothetical protein
MLRKQRLGEKFSGAVEVRILQTGISSPAGFSSGAASGLGVAGFFAAFFAGFFALILAFFAGIPLCYAEDRFNIDSRRGGGHLSLSITSEEVILNGH